MNSRSFMVILFLFCLLPAAGLAAKKNKTGIEPGPLVITPAEAAIVADPGNGIEHAVILVEETDRDESYPTTNKVTYHFRAKILSNEGRDLADITIPYNIRQGKLKQWWGRTILPDGTIHELAQEDLKEQLGKKGASNRSDYVRLKGALPGVEEGAIIDYGYIFQADGTIAFSPIPVQREYQVRKFHFRWVPFRKANYLITHQKALGIDAKSEKQSITFTGKNLPAVEREPYSPPIGHLRATLFLYYNYSGKYQPREYWDFIAKELEDYISSSMKDGKMMQKSLARIPLPKSVPLEVKLKALYDWIGENIENKELRTSERREEQARIDKEKDFSSSVREVLDTKEGQQWQIRLLFMAFARMLGADAHILEVVDRRKAYWEPAFLSPSQFDTFLVAVKAPREPGDKYVVLDPGSGLPYGEIRWWYTTIQGMLCTENGAGTIRIQPPKAERNETVYEAVIGFEDDGELMTMSWTRTATGQSGYAERLYLRDLKPDDREDRLYELCGADGDIEVISATVSDLANIADPLVISCKAESFTDGIEDRAGKYSVSLEGPWTESLPVFVEEERKSPLIFRYAWTSSSSIEIKAPEGFIPRGVYDPVSADTSLGKYSLSITPAGDGYDVQRRFVMPHSSLAAENLKGLMKYFEFIKRADETRIEFVRKPAS